MTPNNRRLLLAAMAVATVLSFPKPAEASVARAVRFEEKVDNAAMIVVGRCTRSEARWDASKRWILTYSTFKVEKSLKGQPATEITVATPGGTVDGIHQQTIGSPIFEPGDEQVLFVANSSIGPTVLYLDQGTYDVREEAGRKVAEPPQSDAVRLDTQRGVAVAPEEPRTLDELERAVKARIQARHNEMQLVREREQKQSLVDVLASHKLLVLLALIGAALATWQLMKQR